MTDATQQKWEGRWERIVGRIKRFWADLTNNDSLRAEGECESRVGARKEQVGKAREEFEELLDQRFRP